MALNQAIYWSSKCFLEKKKHKLETCHRVAGEILEAVLC